MELILVPIIVALISSGPAYLTWQTKRENKADHGRVVAKLASLDATLSAHGEKVDDVKVKVECLDEKVDGIAETVAVNVHRIDRLEHS